MYKLPKDRLYVAYFCVAARRAVWNRILRPVRDIGLGLGVPTNRVLLFGMKDNFWEMGEFGTRGSCTEIHYDHIGERGGPSLSEH